MKASILVRMALRTMTKLAKAAVAPAERRHGPPPSPSRVGPSPTSIPLGGSLRSRKSPTEAVLRLGGPAERLQPGESPGGRATATAVVSTRSHRHPRVGFPGSLRRRGTRGGRRRHRRRRGKGRGHRSGVGGLFGMMRRHRYMEGAAADAAAAMAAAAELHVAGAGRPRPRTWQLRTSLQRLHDGSWLHGELMHARHPQGVSYRRKTIEGSALYHHGSRGARRDDLSRPLRRRRRQVRRIGAPGLARYRR